MRVVRPRPEDRAQSSEPIYRGRVLRQTVVGDGPLRMLEVTFENGARTKLHRHSTGQVLVVTAGSGVVGNERERFSVGPGDVVHTPPGEAHFHGAAEGASLTHLAIIGADNETTILEE